MGHYVDLDWESRFATESLSRRQNQSGKYRAYVPDRLSGRYFAFEATVAADIADAERNITRLDNQAKTLADTEALARILLRAEAVASSKIEGLTISAQRLLRVDVARSEGDETNDADAIEVLANVDAMAYAVSEPSQDISVDRILEIHRLLLEPTHLSKHAGRIREEQNWIGGGGFNPFGAVFVPPPPGEVLPLLYDLCDFCNDDSLPTVAQAAIAHAQFETIHPFVDGNGRTGRALIHMILKRRGLATRTLLPVSLVLATQARDYIAALESTRFDGTSDAPQSAMSTDSWVGLFAGACSRAVADAEKFEQRVEALRAEWRERLGPMRADATALELLERLPATPIVTVQSVQKALAVAYGTANVAIEALVTAGILTQTKGGRRNRAFEAHELVDAFTSLERQMASIDSDTKISLPNRDVPAFPNRHIAPRSGLKLNL